MPSQEMEEGSLEGMRPFQKPQQLRGKLAKRKKARRKKARRKKVRRKKVRRMLARMMAGRMRLRPIAWQHWPRERQRRMQTETSPAREAV